MAKKQSIKTQKRVSISMQVSEQMYNQLAKIAPDGVTVGRMLKTIAVNMVDDKKTAIEYINKRCK